MTVVTGGFESVLYWVFLVLIVRNAVSIPVAAAQWILNFLTIGAYVAAVSLYRSIIELDPLSSPILIDLGREHAGLVMSGQSGQLFLARVLLLVLLTACCYGVEVLVDRGLQADEEAREFASRQDQLASAGRLAAEIAHRLKNPLAIINNAAFSVQRLLKNDASGALEKVQMIRDEVDRSDRILTELMGYAQLAEGRVERLEISAMVNEALVQVFPPAAKFEITIHRDIASGLPPLLMQRAHLDGILVNLLLNAREALGGKGEIRVEVSQLDSGAVRVRVTDNGPGIPERQRRQIFEPYFTTKDKGTGLGLSIVKHNIELYNGTIDVESAVGKGSVFTVEFPAKVLMQSRK
jgi:signal transduction histidine kinase